MGIKGVSRSPKVLNGFTAGELHKITGLSHPMIDYLIRMGFLRPHYSGEGQNPRGKVRFYSYRDLVVGKTIQRFRDGGIQLGRLKTAINELAQDELWLEGDNPAQGLAYVVSDGKKVLLKDKDGFLEELDGTGQRAFAFVVNVQRIQEEVRSAIDDKEKRNRFTMANEELIFAKKAKRRTS